MKQVQLDMRIIDINTGDLINLVKDALQEAVSEIVLTIDSRLNAEPKEPQRPLFGIEGLAQALGVTKTTAQRWKNLGYLEGGYQRIGNIIRIDDPQKLREIASKLSAAKKQKKAAERKGRRVKYSLLTP